MDIDSNLVMNNFIDMMGNFFIVVGFFGVITLAITSVYIYLVHHRGTDNFEDY